VVLVLLSAAAWFYYTVNEALRGDYETIRVTQMVEDYVKTNEGNWPTSWEDLDRTDTAKRFLPRDSSYWRRYTTVDFTIQSEQLIADPELIYHAVMPVSRNYVVYPHARQDLDRVMKAIREARRQPTLPAR
jgi:hypothetical protein